MQKNIQIFHRYMIFFSYICRVKQYNMMLSVVSQYIDIVNNLNYIIDESPYKSKYIIDKMGMKASTFYKKAREKKFTPEEVLSLAKIIDVDIEQKANEKAMVLKGLEEIERGEVIDHSEVMAKANKRLEEWKRNGRRPQNIN